jgi:hypothetical protein
MMPEHDQLMLWQLLGPLDDHLADFFEVAIFENTISISPSSREQLHEIQNEKV